jgi:hypothetical protein
MNTFRENVDWAHLQDAYGAATPIPALLDRVQLGDSEALAELMGRVLHQGVRYSSTLPAARALASLALSTEHLFGMIAPCIPGLIIDEPEVALLEGRLQIGAGLAPNTSDEAAMIAKEFAREAVTRVSSSNSLTRRAAFYSCFWLLAGGQDFQMLVAGEPPPAAPQAEVIERLIGLSLIERNDLLLRIPISDDLSALAAVLSRSGAALEGDLKKAKGIVMAATDILWFDGKPETAILLACARGGTGFGYAFSTLIEWFAEDPFRTQALLATALLLVRTARLEREDRLLIFAGLQATERSEYSFAEIGEIANLLG